jgi:hypothetical protein
MSTRRISLNRVRSLAVGGLTLLTGAVVLAACSSTPVKPKAAATLKPFKIAAAPAGTIALTQPQADGSYWVLSGSPTEKTISKMDATTSRILATVGVSRDASDIAESTTGIVAVSVGSGGVGGVDLFQGSTGAALSTIATSDPVLRISPTLDGTMFFALQSNGSASSIVEITVQTGAIGATVPAPSDTVDAIPTSDASAFLALLPQGVIDEVSITTRKPTARFSSGQAATALTLSSDGATIYVLRGGMTSSNVALVNVRTQAVDRVIPAPSDATDLALSPDGQSIYISDSSPKASNVQAFHLPG